MKRFLIATLLAPVVAAPLTAVAGQTTYINPNYGIVTTPPVINATNFINYGTFSFSTLTPFETFDTVNYTNLGRMVGSPGWRFEQTPSELGARRMAGSFVVENPGVIISVDPDFQALTAPCIVAPVDPSYIIVSATNIVCRSGAQSAGATLVVGPNGLLALTGKSVDLARSGIQIQPVWTTPFGNLFTVPATNYIPDIAVYDNYWSQTNFSDDYRLNSAAIWNGFVATSRNVPFPTSQPIAAPRFQLLAPYADSFVESEGQITIVLTNFTGTSDNVTGTNFVTVTLRTNVTKGAVFASADSSFGIRAGFVPAISGFAAVNVYIDSNVTNSTTQLPSQAVVNITDILAYDPEARGISANLSGCPPSTGRPVNYIVDRTTNSFGVAGNNGYPDANFFTSSGALLADTNVIQDAVSNAVVAEGIFAAYSAYFDSVVSRPASSYPLPGVQDLPGRLRVISDSLDLDNARLRGEGYILLQTRHLISSSNAVVDSSNLLLDLDSATGTLRINSLVRDRVDRMSGNILLWSAVWSNLVDVIHTNNYTFTNITTNIVMAIPTPVTNAINVKFQTFLVDADLLTNALPVSVWDFATRSRATIVDDNLTLVQGLRIDGQSLTLNGNVTIPGALPIDPITRSPYQFGQPLLGWVGTNAPNLLYLTNRGNMDVYDDLHWGDDRPVPYNSVVNTGAVNAASITIHSGYVENSGLLSSGGLLSIQAASGRLENGTSASANNSQIIAGSIRLKNYSLNANGALVLDVTSSLYDDGGSANNLLQVRNGFNLLVKPKTGDLLGTTFETIAPGAPSIAINHQWAAADRGLSVAGYSNNTAVGTLKFTSQSPNPLFILAGTGSQNAMYVDLLSLTTLSAFTNQIRIQPNLKIYYAAAKLGFVPPPWPDGQPRSPEEYLDGLFNGRLIWNWVYAGPQSSQSVVINGQSVLVNKALANSKQIDSDHDGLPNFYDPTPFTEIPGSGITPPASPWIPIAGSYSGLFAQSTEVLLPSSGAISITTTKSGSFSGSVRMGSSRYSFSGQFNTAGAATTSVTRKGASPLTLTLQVDVSDNQQITGTIGDGIWLSTVASDLAAFSKSNPAAAAGKYTMVLPGSILPDQPSGDGYATLSIDTSGRVKLSGVLADGTKISQSSTLSDEGEWALFVPLYGGSGESWGWMSVLALSRPDVSGTVTWIKSPSTAKYYPAGFHLTLDTTGSTFNSAQAPVTGFYLGQLRVTGPEISAPIQSVVTVNNANRATVENGGKLSFKTSQGLFKGSVKDSATGKTVSLKGVLLQRQGTASGFYLGTTKSGRASLAP